MTTIVITVFNITNLLELQVELWRKYLDCEIKVVDNSTNLQISLEVKGICENIGVEFVKSAIYEGDSSRSHGFACNLGYTFYGNCDLIGLVDHDIFPFKPIDLSYMTEFQMAGIQQLRKTFIYLWPGLIFIDPIIGDVDFMPDKINGTHLDTGAGTWHHISAGKPVKFLDELDVEFEGGNYSIVDDTFMHFRNASNWKEEEGHGDRMGNLITVLNEKTQ